MLVVTAIALLSITLPGRPTQVFEQHMASKAECLELAEAWLSQDAEAPVLRHGAKLGAFCQVTVEPTLDH